MGNSNELVSEEFWTVSQHEDNQPRLVGSKCPSCGEKFFPKKKVGICTHCQQRGLEDVELIGKGKIASYTVAVIPPAGGFYHGPVPYTYGVVNLEDMVRIETLFTGCDLEQLRVGMDVKLVIEKLYDDEHGNEVRVYKFTPIKE